ncbi:MAG: acyl carrier protein [Pseudomonadota bacterium]
MNDQTSTADDSLRYFDDVTRIVRQTLQLPEDRVLDLDTALLGDIPEFDSMSVLNVLTEFEERFDFFVEDDEVTGEVFETVGSLLAFVQAKVDGG